MGRGQRLLHKIVNVKKPDSMVKYYLAFFHWLVTGKERIRIDRMTIEWSIYEDIFGTAWRDRLE